MIDFHSHILPGIDDGAKNEEMSLEMLKISLEQGVEAIVASSHFDGESESVEGFLERRALAKEKLDEAVKESGAEYPKVLLGAEVYMIPGISELKGIEKLCIEGTNSILLEMPMESWNEWLFAEVYKISSMGLVPVMAHLERYADKAVGMANIRHLMDMDVHIQINASDVGKLRYRKAVKEFLLSGRRVVVGSDTHNITTRKSEMDTAFNKIMKKYGYDMIERIEIAEQMLLDSENSY